MGDTDGNKVQRYPYSDVGCTDITFHLEALLDKSLKRIDICFKKKAIKI